MIKKFIKLLLYFLILIAIGIVYLSYFGIETKRFNQLIRDEISESNKKIDIELKDVKIILNLANFTIGLKTKDSNILLCVKLSIIYEFSILVRGQQSLCFLNLFASIYLI